MILLLKLLTLGCTGAPATSDTPPPTVEDTGPTDTGPTDTGPTDTGPADTGTEAAPEDCGDGVDNDLDGLVDCEDADCTESCTEDCSDGVDNDLDGYADCQDSSCWGIAPCAQSIQVRLESGQGALQSEHWTPLASGEMHWTFEVALENVTGTGTLSLESSSLSCAWSASALDLTSSYDHWDGQRRRMTARRVESSGACGGQINTQLFNFAAFPERTSTMAQTWDFGTLDLPLSVSGAQVLDGELLSSTYQLSDNNSWQIRGWDARFALTPGGPWRLWEVP